MIKHTLYFGTPARLSFAQKQLLVKTETEVAERHFSVEDVGAIILDHPQISVSHTLLYQLLHHNVAVIACDEKHMPVGIFQPLEGHSMQAKVMREQIEASSPLKKSLWAGTVEAKIRNQNAVLAKYGAHLPKLEWLSKRVSSGDTQNHEGQAAALYWPVFLHHATQHIADLEAELRDRYGDPPNNLLNYGYAILRATMARSLVASGLNPSYGIHHRNQYNAFALADDLMEPYRPFVDLLVLQICRSRTKAEELDLTKQIKRELLSIPVLDVRIGKRTCPLMIATQMTTASLARCFAGELRKIQYPTL